MIHTNKLGYFGKGSVEIGPAAGPGEGPIQLIEITSVRLAHHNPSKASKPYTTSSNMLHVHMEPGELLAGMRSSIFMRRRRRPRSNGEEEVEIFPA